MRYHREDMNMPNDPFDLDRLIADARRDEPAPGAAFIAAALASAYAVAAANTPVPKVVRQPRKSDWPGFLRDFGGWKSAAALTASTLAGLWIGYGDWQGLSSSGLLANIAPTLESQIATLDSFDGIDAMFVEG